MIYKRAATPATARSIAPLAETRRLLLPAATMPLSGGVGEGDDDDDVAPGAAVLVVLAASVVVDP